MAQSHCTDTVFAVSRPEIADETTASGTDKSVPYSYRFEFRQNRYICQQSSAYGADLFTPHLPQAASSPQAPQGEDNGVRRKFCTNIAQPNVARGNCGFHRSLEPGHQRYAYQCKLKAPLKKRETLRFPPQFRTGQQNRLPHSRYARQLWFRRYPRHRATRDKCIRRCAKAPLKIL